MSKLLTADLASIEISWFLHNRDLHLVPFCVILIHHIKSHKLSSGGKTNVFLEFMVYNLKGQSLLFSSPNTHCCILKSFVLYSQPENHNLLLETNKDTDQQTSQQICTVWSAAFVIHSPASVIS